MIFAFFLQSVVSEMLPEIEDIFSISSKKLVLGRLILAV